MGILSLNCRGLGDKSAVGGSYLGSLKFNVPELYF